MRPLPSLLLTGFLLTASPAHAQPAQDNHVRLAAILSDYDRYDRTSDPVSAASDGDAEALSRLPDVSPTAMAAHRRILQGIKLRLAALAAGGLSDEEALDRDLLARTVDDSLQSLAFDEAREPFTSYSSFSNLAQELSSTPIRGETDAKAWIARLKAFPRYFADNIANARRGVATGFVQPRRTVEIVLAAARKQAATPPADGPYMAPLKDLPPIIPSGEQSALRTEALDIVTREIAPQQQAYVRFLETEYLPHARASLAVRDLPGGDAYYAYVVRHHTTTDMTPDQIHALGLSEVARIRGEMDRLIASIGFKGSFKDFQAFLRTDPQFYTVDPEVLADRYARIAKRVDNELPRFFSKLPRLPFGIRPIPADTAENATTAYYQPGSPALGIAGGYMINLTHLDQRPFYEMPALTLHESQPGHHLQISLAQELTDIPRFRRNAYLTAYLEGWAVYSEQLGEDMAIYRTPYEHFGRLSYEMWRACRLVADTGIHWLRWTRPQAEACFLDNTALAPKNIQVEVDRYIAWPGQALAYKIGELKIMELRHRAEAQLGPRFDIRRFHDEVLAAGPLPLGVLDTRVSAWIATQRAAP